MYFSLLLMLYMLLQLYILLLFEFLFRCCWWFFFCVCVCMCVCVTVCVWVCVLVVLCSQIWWQLPGIIILSCDFVHFRKVRILISIKPLWCQEKNLCGREKSGVEEGRKKTNHSSLDCVSQSSAMLMMSEMHLWAEYLDVTTCFLNSKDWLD